MYSCLENGVCICGLCTMTLSFCFFLEEWYSFFEYEKGREVQKQEMDVGINSRDKKVR